MAPHDRAWINKVCEVAYNSRHNPDTQRQPQRLSDRSCDKHRHNKINNLLPNKKVSIEYKSSALPSLLFVVCSVSGFCSVIDIAAPSRLYFTPIYCVTNAWFVTISFDCVYLPLGTVHLVQSIICFVPILIMFVSCHFAGL